MGWRKFGSGLNRKSCFVFVCTCARAVWMPPNDDLEFALRRNSLGEVRPRTRRGSANPPSSQQSFLPTALAACDGPRNSWPGRLPYSRRSLDARGPRTPAFRIIVTKNEHLPLTCNRARPAPPPIDPPPMHPPRRAGATRLSRNRTPIVHCRLHNQQRGSSPPRLGGGHPQPAVPTRNYSVSHCSRLSLAFTPTDETAPDAAPRRRHFDAAACAALSVCDSEASTGTAVRPTAAAAS